MALLAGANEALDYHQEAIRLREQSEELAAHHLHATERIIHSHVLREDWPAIQSVFQQFSEQFPDSSLALVSLRGEVLLSSRPQHPPPAALLDGPGLLWSEPNRVLWVSTDVRDAHGQARALLVGAFDRSAQFTQMNKSRTQHILLFLLGLMAVLIALIITYRLLVFRSLNQMYEMARAVRRGDRHMRAPASHILEFERIRQAFNEMLDHLAEQRAALERFNHELEDTINQRTQELRASNQALREQTRQLEAINAVVSSAAARLDLPSLARLALEQALAITGASQGLIIIRGEMQVIGLSPTAGQALLEQTGGDSLFTLPIYADLTQAGQLAVACPRGRSWRLEETALLEILTHQLGISIEHHDYLENIRGRNRQMRAFMQQSERLNRTLTVSQILSAIGEGAQALSQADRLVVIYQNRQGQLECIWTHQLSEAFLSCLQEYGRRMYPGEAGAIIPPDPILVPDLLELDDPTQGGDLAGWEGIRAYSVWPLTYQGQASAFVACFYDQPQPKMPAQQEIFAAFCRQAAAALENARLFEAESRQRRLAEALREISERLTSTLDLDEVLQGILDLLERVVPHDGAEIMLLEESEARPVRWNGLYAQQSELLKVFRYKLREFPEMQVTIQTGKVMVISDTHQNPIWVRVPEFDWIRSYASAPIFQRGKVTGLINVCSTTPNFYDPEIMAPLQAFANQAAIALENAQRYHTTEQRMEETSTLYRALQPLFSPLEDIPSLARQITEAVTQEFSSAHCSLLLLDENQSELKIVSQSGEMVLDTPQLRLDGAGITVRAALSGQVIYVPDVSLDPSYVAGAPQSRSELAIPLRAGGQIIGVINLESPQIDAFDERGQRLLASFADRAALSLENARLFATVRQHAEQMNQLNRLTHTALKSSDLKTMLQQMAQQVGEMLVADSVYITLFDEENQRTIPFAAFDPNAEEYTALSVAPRQTTITSTVLKRGHTMIIEDVRKWPYLDMQTRQQFPVNQILALPLIANEQKLGSLLVGFVSAHTFTPSEVALGEQTAGQIALAMVKMRSLEVAQSRAQEAETLRQATAALSSTLDLQQVLDSILTHLQQVIHHDSACMFLLETEDSLRIRAVKNLTDAPLLLDRCLPRKNQLFQAIEQTQRPVALEDACQDHRFEGWGGSDGARSWMGVPLIAGREYIGALTLDRREVRPFIADEMELAQAFANQAAVAVQNAQLHGTVQYMAVTDTLTELLNRRGFFKHAGRINDEWIALNRPYSAIMMDIDFFKSINDGYGHDAGDQVLRAIAERSRKALRDGDLICRYGGEEFAILLPESDQEGALRAARRLFKNITATAVETAAGPVQITVSIGVATCNESMPCHSIDHLLKRADQALYLAKSKGRNQVCVWTP